MSKIVQLSYDRAIERGTEHDIVPKVLLATHGHFSKPFFNRQKYALEILPGIVEHVVSLMVASGGSESDIQSTREIPVPFNAQAWDDANELYRLLVYWTGAFATTMRLQAPGPAKRAWRNDNGRVVGLPAGVSPKDARYATGVMSKWLLIQLEAIMHLDPEDVTIFATGMADVYRVNARWPQKDRSVWSKLPCPNCGGRLAIYPPEPPAQDRQIVCDACRHVLDEDDYERRVEEQAQATKVAQQLARKYATRMNFMAEKTTEPATPDDLRQVK